MRKVILTPKRIHIIKNAQSCPLDNLPSKERIYLKSKLTSSSINRLFKVVVNNCDSCSKSIGGPVVYELEDKIEN